MQIHTNNNVVEWMAPPMGHSSNARHAMQVTLNTAVSAETRNLVQKSHVIDCNRMRLIVNRMWKAENFDQSHPIF